MSDNATRNGEEEQTPLLDQAIGTEAGQVAKRFESWDDAKEWCDDGHARNVYSMPTLTEAGEYDADDRRVE